MCENVEGSRPRELFEDLIDDIEEDIENKLDDFEDLLRDGYKARELFGDTTWEKAESCIDTTRRGRTRLARKRARFSSNLSPRCFDGNKKERKRREGGGDRDDASKRSRRDGSVEFQ